VTSQGFHLFDLPVLEAGMCAGLALASRAVFSVRGVPGAGAVAPLRHEVQEIVNGQLDPQLRAPVHHIPGTLDRIVRRVLQQRPGTGVPACVQPAQDAHRQLHYRRRHAQLAAANEVVEERLQGLVEDLVGGLACIDVAPSGVVSRPAVELVDVVKAQCGLYVVGDRGPVLIDQPPPGEGFDLLP
jgi:hypothetical protein